MDTVMEQNRRFFPRVKVRTYGRLQDSAGRGWPVHILDLSFDGALAALIHQHDLRLGEKVVLDIETDDGQAVIRMEGRLCHQREHFIGISCRPTGIDSQTQLRELLKRSQRKYHSLANRSYRSLLDAYEP